MRKGKQSGSLRTGEIKSAASLSQCQSPKLFPVDKDAGRISLTLGHACKFITFFVCGMYNRVLDETRFQSANITVIVVCIPGTKRWGNV